MNTETINFARTTNKDFALKLLEWHGGQYTGMYALGSSLLAWATNRDKSGGQFIPPPEVVGRALGELRSIHGHDEQPECDALIAEVKRRYTHLPKLDDFTLAYVQCALWSSTDDDDKSLNEHFTLADLAPETVEKIKTDCARFQMENGPDIETGVLRENPGSGDYAEAGHDFWLTRNGHGCGFWDGDWPHEAGERLTKASKQFGECGLYVGDDGQLYL